MNDVAILVSELERYPTATLYEAMGRHGAMDVAIKPLAGGMRLAGPAFTVRCAPFDSLAVHRALDEVPANTVLVIDAGKGYMGTYCGGIICRAAVGRGVAGILVDGFVRDAREIRAQGLPVFCRGCALSGTYKNAPGELQVSVVCGGVHVAPGDIVVGDDDGVVIIPSAIASSVLDAAKERDEWERHMLDGLAAGRTTLDLLGLKEDL